MNFEMFKSKVQLGADFLRSACKHGDPSEEEVTEATTAVGLPVTFEGDSFVMDPVRFAVFTTAYRRSNITCGVGIESVIKQGFVWMKRHQLETGTSV